MAQLFISYARPDAAMAEQVVRALAELGHDAWHDEQLPAHRAYGDVIEERLAAADAVLVLWSEEAARSEWVRAEADMGRNQGKLIQARLDNAALPLPFNQIQAADLQGWTGEAAHAGWATVRSSIEHLAAPPTPAPAPASSGASNAAKPAKRSICVLPFANMSGDPEQDYFSDGISEDITTDLSKVSALAVTARNTAFQYKGRAVNICQVARLLGVTHILEGSVRKAGTKVRITAQLIDGASGEHVWAERYDRDLTDIFAIQDEISEAIVGALKLRLLPQEKRSIEERGTTSAEAYDLYLMARQYWAAGNWGDVRHLELVERICIQALAVDPDYARALGLLAIIRCILHFTFGASDKDGKEEAERALALDPENAEAMAVRARHHYERGEFDLCNAELKQALKLAPESWEVNREAGRIYYFQRRFDEAIVHFGKAVELDGSDFHSSSMQASAYMALGRTEKVRETSVRTLKLAEQAVAHDLSNGSAHGCGAYALATLGERERFEGWMKRALLINPDNILMKYHFVCVTAAIWQDGGAAARLLDPMLDGLSASALKATIADPDFDPVRADPHFARVMERAKSLLAEKDA